MLSDNHKPLIAELSALAAITACARLCYSNTLHAPLIMDGAHFIGANPAITKLSEPGGLAELFYSFPSRFLPFLSFALNYSFTRLSLPAMHITNIMLHAANGMLVYFLIRTILDRQNEQARLPALAGALFFVLHPVQTQAVTYVYQRIAELAACFYLSACALFLAAIKTDRRDGLKYWAAFACTAAAYYTKENTYTIPFAMLAGGYILHGRGFTKRLTELVPFALLWLPASMNLVMSETFDDISKLSSVPDITPLQYLAAQGSVLLTYLRLIVWPSNQMLLYDMQIPEQLFSARVLASWTAVSAILCALGYAARKNRAALFGLAFFVIALSVESSIIPLDDIIFEHRLYLPLAGLAVMLAALLAAIKENFLKYTITALVLGALGITAFSRNAVWKTEVSILADNFRKAPGRVETASDLGAALIAQRDFQSALAVLGAAAKIAPKYTPTYANLGLALYYTGNTEAAELSFKKALANNPDKDRALVNLGNLAKEKGDYTAALDYYAQASAFSPKNALAMVNAAQVRIITGDRDIALAILQKATAARPDYARGWLELGRLLYFQKEFAKAANAYENGIKAEPADFRLHQEAAAAFAQAGNTKKASYHQNMAQQLAREKHQ